MKERCAGPPHPKYSCSFVHLNLSEYVNKFGVGIEGINLAPDKME
jgi:hypothetical protein